ncbi:MAG: insulinase family protein [Calditrichaeota bacterium]|nr:MAG: insulinase family protein [bacterium]RQV98071.1 MAG: insulinase family protein [Calditrichota bacterium]
MIQNPMRLYYNQQFPPIDTHLLEFDFPEPAVKKLSSGLTVLFILHHQLPKIYIRLGLDLGNKHDPASKAGLAELLSYTIKKGTVNRTYQDIISSVEQVGGELDTAGNEDFLVIHGEFLREYLDTGLDIIQDMVLNPNFPPEEVEKERQKQIADLENEKSSPQFLASRRLEKALYDPHPYGIHKTLSSLQNITREDLLEKTAERSYPAGAFLVLAGDISIENSLKKIEDNFKPWNTPIPETDYPREPRKTTVPQIHIVHRPDSEQTNIVMGNLLFARKHPDYEKMLVMNKILGGGGSGRLFLNLREEKGYTYGAYSTLQTNREQGIFLAHGEVRNEVVTESIQAFQQEFRRMQDEKVPEDELRNAVRYLLGIFPLQNETPSSIAALALKQRLYDLGDMYWKRYAELIKSVSAEDVREMAGTHIRQDRMVTVVVGDAKKLAEKLENLGEIHVFDQEDNPLDEW